MAFQASKTRQKRARKPVAEGKTLTPNAAVEAWYRGQLRALCAAMVDDYRAELKDAIEHPDAERFFGLDAATDDLFKRVLNRLRRKWNDVFKGAAAKLSTDFVDKVDTVSKTSSWFSMSAMGIEEPRVRYTDSVRQTIDATKEYNFTLITNISEEVHEKVYSAVMLSLTSPDPEQQGVSGITNALREIGKFSEKRIELIARDQNAKLYSFRTTTLNTSDGCIRAPGKCRDKRILTATGSFTASTIRDYGKARRPIRDRRAGRSIAAVECAP
jgi:uncharacterized protein with gpF-like domain